jgi:hypothetical protein
VPAVGTAQEYNRVVNGAMQHSQENGNTAVTTVSAYTVDQWVLFNNSATGVISIQRVQVPTPKGSRDRLRLTVTTADASLTTNEALGFIQRIEGIRVADFGWGSASARQVVLRFGLKAPAGIYSIGIKNSAQDRSYVANFTVAAGQANTDTEQVFVIPGDVTGTWPVDNSLAMILIFCFGAGPTLTGAAGWQAGNFNATSSNTNGFTPINNVYELFDVGLYLDPNATGVPPPWQTPDYASELTACQRYWQRIQANLDGHVISGTGYSAAAPYYNMRTSPTATAVNVQNTSFPATPSIVVDSYMAYDSRTASATARGVIRSIITLNGRM